MTRSSAIVARYLVAVRLGRGLLGQRHLLRPRGAVITRLGRHVFILEQLTRKLWRLFTAEIVSHYLVNFSIVQLNVDTARVLHSLVLTGTRYVLARWPQSLCSVR